MIVCAYVLGSG